MSVLNVKNRVRGLKRKVYLFLINNFLSGTRYFKLKRKMLNTIGISIGENTKVVGPIECYGKLTVGSNCWIGKNIKINGNGVVIIGDNCDIAPEVIFQTGGHKIGSTERRAGEGVSFSQSVGSGTWIGSRVTIFNETHIGCSCVIAGCACVTSDVPDNLLVGGVPAKMIRILNDEKNK